METKEVLFVGTLLAVVLLLGNIQPTGFYAHEPRFHPQAAGTPAVFFPRVTGQDPVEERVVVPNPTNGGVRERQRCLYDYDCANGEICHQETRQCWKPYPYS